MILQNICLFLIWGDVKERKETKKIQYHWAYQLLFRPHELINQWLYIELMGITT